MIKKIPNYIIEILQELEEAGFEAYVVGGCVRDLIMDREPKDWDITTNAQPEEVIKVFGKKDSFYENEFGTVGIKIRGKKKNRKTKDAEVIDVVEVTTFRIESKYTDKRHPDEVRFAETLEEDLSRRDFTCNAIALQIKSQNKDKNLPPTPPLKREEEKKNYEIIDLFNGQKDIKNMIIRAVGDPNERFNEDALRMMRAIRFAGELGFSIEKKTLEAIKKNAKNLNYISKERVRDELSKIILSDHPAESVELLRKSGLLKHILPELEEGVGIEQNRHHIYTIYKHNLMSLKKCPSIKLEVRLAALLHDIAKPITKRGKGYHSTFYNHDHVGARVAEKILKRLRFSVKTTEKVKLLINNHMFYYNPDEVGESSVRRLIKKVGLENIKDLIDVRIADRLGSGVPKAKPYKLRHLEYIIDKVSHDAISVKMLEINGNDFIQNLKIKPGPIIGAILEVLLAETIEKPSRNNREYLLKRAKELKNKNLSQLRALAKEKIEEKKEEEDKEIKRKYWVK